MKALVTGGGGFLGGAVVDALLARGDTVTSLARGDYPALRERGVTTVRGDLTDPAAAREAVTGADVVFHVAARAGILDRARSGWLRFVGDGSAIIDTTYVDDAARAHLDAAERLAPGAYCAGRPYFVTSGDPRPVHELVNGIVVAGGLEPVRGTVPLPVAVAAGAAVETVWRVLDRVPGLGDVGDPPMTRILARHLATAHWFDIGAARRDLGYVPRVPLDEGFVRLAESLRAAA